MAKTEAGKALEAKQKEAARAAKERRRTSDNPNDWGLVRQLTESYKFATKQDPKFPLVLFGALLGPLVLLLALGLVLAATVKLAWWLVVLLALLGLVVGVYLAQTVLIRRVKAGSLKQYEGQAGSGEVALRMLPKEWQHDAAIAFTRHQDVVHRALGPGGLFLIGEGDPGRVRALLATETKRHDTAMYGVKAKPVLLGNGQGQVPLKELTKYLTSQEKTLDKVKVEEAAKRLRALDAVRNKMMLPAGPLPQAKGSRRAMRGR